MSRLTTRRIVPATDRDVAVRMMARVRVMESPTPGRLWMVTGWDVSGQRVTLFTDLPSKQARALLTNSTMVQIHGQSVEQAKLKWFGHLGAMEDQRGPLASQSNSVRYRSGHRGAQTPQGDRS